ncbi:putative arginine permease [Talaromyces proteolyticus]|uniref:Arginine permease n=1 Tax=Talaromyces proteolyticus TaxID=1131652 RepID=A0AAD4KLM8_9EURO|nr:putative arginine permease [Talaromyces proteolyticus]KAH8692061.1 putative arginine permease [Talaromyces proteolyticus]
MDDSKRMDVPVDVNGDCTMGQMDTQSDRFGHVERRLKSRHIQFMALGGAIGTSLFLGIGSSLSTAGPANLLLGFAISGFAVYGMMLSLGEMTTWLPIPGAIPTFCSRYVDEALGFAVGWNNWYFASIVVCLEISAASVVIDYWPGAQRISPAVWITIIIIFILALNVSAVGIFGEAEFVFTSIKLIAIIGLMILSVVIMAGGAPNNDAIGFKYWNNPGAMNELSPATGPEGRFLAFFSVLVYACFTYAGVEMLAAAGGETEHPRVNIPIAFRRVVYRILGFYVLGTLFVGCIVASNDPNLLTALATDASGAAQSPWVIGLQNAGITVLPSIINAVILTSAVSSANAMLYTGSRYLYSLAKVGQAPRVLLNCTKNFCFFINVHDCFSCRFDCLSLGMNSLFILQVKWIFGVFYIFWKILKGTKVHLLEDVDLVTGKAEIDALDDIWETEHPKTLAARLCNLV